MHCRNVGWCFAVWVSSSTMCCRGFVSTPMLLCTTIRINPTQPALELNASAQYCLSCVYRCLPRTAGGGHLPRCMLSCLQFLLLHCRDSWYGWGDRSMLLCYTRDLLWAGCDSLGGHDMAEQVQLSSQHRGTREKAAAEVQVACLRSPVAEPKINQHQSRDLKEQHYLLGWKGVRPQSKSILQVYYGTGSSKESRWQVSGHLIGQRLPRNSHIAQCCDCIYRCITWAEWTITAVVAKCLSPTFDNSSMDDVFCLSNLFWTHTNVIVWWLHMTIVLLDILRFWFSSMKCQSKFGCGN